MWTVILVCCSDGAIRTLADHNDTASVNTHGMRASTRRMALCWHKNLICSRRIAMACRASGAEACAVTVGCKQQQRL